MRSVLCISCRRPVGEGEHGECERAQRRAIRLRRLEERLAEGYVDRYMAAQILEGLPGEVR